MTIFDSNIWIASYVPIDSTHYIAKQFLEEYSGIYFLTEGIVSEVITVLKKYKQLGSTKTFAKIVYQSNDFEVIPSSRYHQNTIEYFLNSNDTKLSFVDMSLVVLSTQYKIETFDKSLKAEIKALR